MIGTEGEVLQALQDLAQRREGWTFLPCDEPRQGLAGVIAFRQVEEEEEQRTFQWALHGVPLEPEVESVGFPGMVDFIERMGTNSLVSCDDPRRRCIGFAVYDVQNHRAIVKEIPLTRIKDGEETERRNFMGLVQRKQAEAHEGANERMRLCAAATAVSQNESS